MTSTQGWAALEAPDHSQWFVAQTPAPVLDLIQWVCSTHPHDSRRWLRSPLLLAPETYGHLTAMERMAVKVFAKRVRKSADLLPPRDAQSISPAPHAPDKQLLATLPPLLDSDEKVAQYLNHQLMLLPTERGHSADRAILALALDAQGRPLGIARARNGLRRDGHAEWILMQSLSAEERARVSHVWTTLKPCRFCATLLYPISVTYLEHDPGPWGHRTCLDAGSPDRERFFPDDITQRERLWDTGSKSTTSTIS